jgi:S-adenosylhomocysteine hydrolase
MSFSISHIEGVNPFDVWTVDSTKPEIPASPIAVGTRIHSALNGEFVCVSNAISTALEVGDVVFMNAAFAASELSTSNDARGQIVGVTVAAIPGTSGTVVGYGWVQVKGTATARVLGLAAANARLNTTATAGALDDDGTAGSFQVQGIYLTTTNGAATAATACVLNYPFVDVTL